MPAGLIAPGEALAFGLTLALLSVLTLAVVANLLAAALLAFTIFFYVVIYTMWLKRSTPQNIVIGGAAGALPPVVGCAAACGQVTFDSVLLFALIFMWTPPHFWALALVKARDYERAGVPMMPNAKGPDRTRLEILVYSLLLAPIGVLPWSTGAGGRALRRRGDRARRRAHRLRAGASIASATALRPTSARCALFGFSILYLFALFGAARRRARLRPHRAVGALNAMADVPSAPGRPLTPQQIRNRRLRNIAIGLAVAFLAVLFYAITIVKIGPGVLRPEG